MSAETPTESTTPAPDAAPVADAPAADVPPVPEDVAAAIARGEAAVADFKLEQAAAKKKAAEKPKEKPQPAPPAPTPTEIEADIEAARERLTSTLVQLEDAVTPASFARRGKTAVRNAYLDEHGGVKIKSVAITAGVVVGVVVVIKILK